MKKKRRGATDLEKLRAVDRAEWLRKEASHLSWNRIAYFTGIPAATLSRWRRWKLQQTERWEAERTEALAA